VSDQEVRERYLQSRRVGERHELAVARTAREVGMACREVKRIVCETRAEFDRERAGLECA
jgi:hypothetical protein